MKCIDNLRRERLTTGEIDTPYLLIVKCVSAKQNVKISFNITMNPAVWQIHIGKRL